MSRRSVRRAFGVGSLLLALAAVGCRPKSTVVGPATCAGVEVQHPGVEIGGAPLTRLGRVDAGGAVRTARDGRAVVTTDDGLELRLAGDTEVTFPEGRPTVQRGRVFVTGWGERERAVGLGLDARVQVGDAALEIERGVSGQPATRVIVVRGEVSFQSGGRQGQASQGEALEGDRALELRPAGVWDDWTGGAASPQGVVYRGAHGAGRITAHAEAGEAPLALAVNEHRVRVEVRGDLAITVVDQRFFNGADRALPAEYRLRVPEGAIVSGFAVERAGRRSVAHAGTIGSRVAGGGMAALVGRGQREVVATLGYLSPGESVRTELTYAQWLSHDGAHRAYVYPVGDPVAPPLVGEFSFDLDLGRAGARTARIPEGARLEDRHVRMRRSDWRPMGDLVVDLVDERPRANPGVQGWRSGANGPDGNRHLMVDVSLPVHGPSGTDVSVVVDVSAATAPGSLDVARAAVDALLHQLGTNDRVALYLGDLTARPADGAAGRMDAPTDERREAILDAVAHARPGGASNLGRMLVDATGALDPRRNGVVFYLGDALPTVGTVDPERLVEETARQAPNLRLYALTLGRESHPEVLEALAVQGGMVARVEDRAEAVTEASRLLAHALRPCLRDVVVDLGNTVAHPLPSRLATWVEGDPLRVIGELTDDPPKDVTVTAREGSERRRWTLRLPVRDAADDGDLSRRWAHARVDALGRTGSGRAAIAEIGARYGLVTPVSALVLDTEGMGALPPSFAVTESPWGAEDGSPSLPRLGVGGSLLPRGVQGLASRREMSIAVDDGSGWQPHAAGENRGAGGTSALVAALAAAEPAARACVERKRALRPGLSGSVTVSAAVDATGRVTAAAISSTTLGDAETEGCIRRAVQGLSLPEPALLGAVPGTVERSFDFGALVEGAGASPGARRCPSTATLPRSLRRVLWSERLTAQGAHSAGAVAVWRGAVARCELRWWEDRVALLELLLERITDPAELATLRDGLADPAAEDWLDAAVARRYGPTQVWRAYARHPPYVDWDALLTRLATPGLTVEQRIAIVRAWLAVAPRDVDLRLRLLSLLEEANRTRDARTLGDRLRRDPMADARVRGRVAEFLLRAGDRDEALRTFTEIAEFAPYDPYARGRLGDLLLTYGWSEEAYRQYQTLLALRPGDPAGPVRLALAALAAGREDEGLRTLRRAVEESGGDPASHALQSMLDLEVARVAARRPNDPAVRAWLRVARQFRASRDTELVATWTHPDVGLEFRALPPSETLFATVGEAPAPLGLRVFRPDTALEGTRLIVRAATGVSGRRSVEARLAMIVGGDRDARPAEETLRFDAEHRAYGFVVRDGRLVAEPPAATEVPGAVEALY